MGDVIAYMLTWTTYGSWLQGDERGWVRDGKIYQPNKALFKANKESQKQDEFVLSKMHIEKIRDEIYENAKSLNQHIFALAVCKNHIHLLANNIDKPIHIIGGYYKSKTTKLLKRLGVESKVWTRGFDKRYCYDKKDLSKRIKYIENHNN